MRSRAAIKSGSCTTYTAPALPLSVSSTSSISSARRTSRVMISESSVRAAAFTAAISAPPPGALAILTSTARLRRSGMTSRNNSNRLPARSRDWFDSPVTLLPGRARLATMPVPTGSGASMKTIGTADVMCFAAGAAAPDVTMTSTLCRTSPSDRFRSAQYRPPPTEPRMLSYGPRSNRVRAVAAKRRDPRAPSRRCARAQEPDSRQLRRLLRAGQERPCARRATNNADKLPTPHACPSFDIHPIGSTSSLCEGDVRFGSNNELAHRSKNLRHSTTSSASASTVGGISRLIDFAVLRLSTNK